MVHLRNSTLKAGMKGEQLSIEQLQLTQLVLIVQLRVNQSVAGPLVRPDGSLAIENLLNRTRTVDQIVTGLKTFETVKSLWNVTTKTINGQTLDNFTTDSSRYGHSENRLLFGLFLVFFLIISIHLIIADFELI